MAFEGYGLRAPTTALTRPRTVYVDSANGNDDTGDGTQARPWATLQRAWIERKQYLELRAPFVIQLLGVGPYDIDFDFSGSECAAEGRFIVLGDPAAVTVLATGTATGDMAGNVVPTSAIAGGPFPNDYAQFTSGNLTGCLFQLTETAANSFTVATKSARDFNGAIAPGDTWRIIRPATEIRINNGFVTPNQPYGISNLRSIVHPSSLNEPAHWFYGVRFTPAGGANAFRVNNCNLGLGFCRSEIGFATLTASSICTAPNDGSGVPGAGNWRIAGAGLYAPAGTFALWGGLFLGPLACGGPLSVQYGQKVSLFGGTFGAILMLNDCFFESFSTRTDQIHRGMITVDGQNAFLRMNAGAWRFAVTAGSCLRAIAGGQVLQLAAASVTVSGGTSDAAGYGVDVRGGGRVLFRNVTPTLTGGTPGSDLRTTNVPVAANAALNANNVAVGNASDALLGEVLARVA